MQPREAVLGGQVGWAAYTGSECGPVRLLESLLRWGVASVVAAPAHSQAGTRAATERLFPLMVFMPNRSFNRELAEIFLFINHRFLFNRSP